jgi:phospholipase C
VNNRDSSDALAENFTQAKSWSQFEWRKNWSSIDQLGFRVPLIAVSPFAKPHYVSDVVSDHASVLPLIEERFMMPFNGGGDDHPHLTRRDQFANTLEDMFNFENSPSLNTNVMTSVLPINGCGPFSGVSSNP